MLIPNLSPRRPPVDAGGFDGESQIFDADRLQVAECHPLQGPHPLQPRSSARFGSGGSFPARLRRRRAHCSGRASGSNHKLRAFGTLTDPFPLLLTRASFTSVPFPLSSSSLRLRRAVLGAKSPWLVCACRDAVAERDWGLHRVQLVQAGHEDKRQDHRFQVRCFHKLHCLLRSFRLKKRSCMRKPP